MSTASSEDRLELSFGCAVVGRPRRTELSQPVRRSRNAGFVACLPKPAETFLIMGRPAPVAMKDKFPVGVAAIEAASGGRIGSVTKVPVLAVRRVITPSFTCWRPS